MRFLNARSEEIVKLKKIVNNYQKAFATQQKTLKLKKRKRDLIIQFLNYEFNCYKAIEKSLKQKRAYVQNFIEFLNTFEISKKANLNDNASINTI